MFLLFGLKEEDMQQFKNLLKDLAQQLELNYHTIKKDLKMNSRRHFIQSAGLAGGAVAMAAICAVFRASFALFPSGSDFCGSCCFCSLALFNASKIDTIHVQFHLYNK